MIEQRLHAYVEALRVEHREVNELVHRLQHMLAEPGLLTGGDGCLPIVERLIELREQLARHFAQEEDGGYLEEALLLAPQLAPQAQRLLAQHQDLLRRLDNLIAMARDAAQRVQPFCQAAADVLKAVLAHEAAENRIVQRAYNLGDEAI